ncbi:hypothetical protein PUN28_017726 [Cardiocondyla obscurior]|uniref:Secreted protein n=1 Tax=Cardiocondyla obscurior TaxID=286306 RepID=A0AAW2EMN6_9HYME
MVVHLIVIVIIKANIYFNNINVLFHSTRGNGTLLTKRSEVALLQHSAVISSRNRLRSMSKRQRHRQKRVVRIITRNSRLTVRYNIL